MSYEAPTIEDLGDVASLTGQLDKIGNETDIFMIQNLDGTIIDDP